MPAHLQPDAPPAWKHDNLLAHLSDILPMYKHFARHQGSNMLRVFNKTVSSARGYKPRCRRAQCLLKESVLRTKISVILRTEISHNGIA